MASRAKRSFSSRADICHAVCRLCSGGDRPSDAGFGHRDAELRATLRPDGWPLLDAGHFWRAG
eukprot:2501277-Lingulodinium_polyedra.AAC.1